MALQYAKDQPVSFINQITKVAIVGAGGQVGKLFAEELLKTSKHTVTAITRVGSTSKAPHGVKVVQVDYNDESSLVEGLKGHDALVITLALGVPPDTHSKLSKAAAKAGVRYVVANAYGVDIWGKQGLREDLPVGQFILDNIKGAGNEGLSWFAFFVGPWYEYSLTFSPELLGVDLKNRSIIFFDEGKTDVQFTTLPQIARGLAALFSLKRLPEDENDKSATVQQFANGPVYLSSFTLNQRQIFDSIKRVTKTHDSDWHTSYESTKERYDEGMKWIREGNPLGFGKTIFARVHYPTGDGIFKTHNDVLGLPKEDLDEAMARALSQVSADLE